MSTLDPGTRLESAGKTSAATWIFALIGLALLALAIVLANRHFAIASVLPCLLAATLFLHRERPIAATLKEDALTFDDDPDASIIYTQIEGVRVKGGIPDSPEQVGQAAPIDVEFRGGCVRIPSRVNERSDGIYRFLLARVPPFGSRDVHGTLTPFLREQIEAFGEDRVYSYNTAIGLRMGKPRMSTSRAVCGALLLSSLIWFSMGIALGARRGGEPPNPDVAWAGVGMLLFLGGLIAYLATRRGSDAGRRYAARRLKQASLIISPGGLALAQGDMQGHVHWDELRQVELRKKPRHLAHGTEATPTGIELRMKGVAIDIADIYDRPIQLIHERIMAYWKG